MGRDRAVPRVGSPGPGQWGPRALQGLWLTDSASEAKSDGPFRGQTGPPHPRQLPPWLQWPGGQWAWHYPPAGTSKREKQYQAHRAFGDRRDGVISARTYFYANEAKCDSHMETFLRCIEASGEPGLPSPPPSRPRKGRSGSGLHPGLGATSGSSPGPARSQVMGKWCECPRAGRPLFSLTLTLAPVVTVPGEQTQPPEPSQTWEWVELGTPGQPTVDEAGEWLSEQAAGPTRRMQACPCQGARRACGHG